MSDRLERLREMEAVVWESVLEAAPDKRAPLVAQLRGILAEIEGLSGLGGELSDPVDELEQRRRRRQQLGPA